MTTLETNFEICSQVSRWLVPAGSEITPQLLNGGHGSSGEKKQQQQTDRLRKENSEQLNISNNLHKVQGIPEK